MKQLPLDILLNDRESLIAVDWQELIDLKKRYPYSDLVSQIVAKKHYLETGYLLSSYYEDTLGIQNNPGITYSQMEIWDQESKPFSSKKRSKLKKKKHKKTRNTTIEKSIENYSGFTLWLLQKNIDAGKAESIENKKTQKDTLPLKEEIISESLAKIYEKQGMIKKAIDMYRKLSLKNPKKSTYFAKIIENLKNR